MKLNAFIETPQGRTLNQSGWARKVGVTRGYFSQLVQGEKLPSLDLAYRIELATDRVVRMQDWMENTSGGNHADRLRGEAPPPLEEAPAG